MNSKMAHKDKRGTFIVCQITGEILAEMKAKPTCTYLHTHEIGNWLVAYNRTVSMHTKQNEAYLVS